MSGLGETVGKQVVGSLKLVDMRDGEPPPAERRQVINHLKYRLYLVSQCVGYGF